MSQRLVAATPWRHTAEVLAALTVLGASSCYLPQWGSHVELEVFVAPAAASWEHFGPLDHLIVVPATQGKIMEMRVPGGQESVRLTIDKRTNLPILDYPLVAGRSDLLKPAGAVFPIDLEACGTISMSYREGFLAELLLPVCSAGELLGAVNVRRLRREIWQRSNGDPWRLDRDAILQTLVFGIMRSDRIRVRPCFDLSLEANPGTWVCNDPFYGPAIVESNRPMMVLEGLPLGTHHFFRTGAEVAQERIDVQVTETGWAWMNSVTGRAGSGRW